MTPEKRLMGDAMGDLRGATGRKRTMSPTTKKILMIGGAAVAGFVAYKVIKARTRAAAAAAAAAAIAAPQATKTQMQLATRNIAGLTVKMPTFSKVAGVEEELGVSEDLGSLGGGF